MSDAAVVLLSGGLDSATVLALARAQGYRCHAMSFRYGQRHEAELEAAQRVAAQQGAAEHRIVDIDLAAFGGSALTDPDIEIPQGGSAAQDGDIPLTYVPARNTVFLSYALAWSEVLAADAIFIGVNAVDYSGYPDCRPEYVAAFEEMANLATRRGVEGHCLAIRAPLIDWSKAEIVQRGTALGVEYGLTVSCYQADESGRACGRCDACHLRAQGFDQAGLPDPTPYQRPADSRMDPNPNE